VRAVPVPALVHDEAVVHLKESTSSEALRTNPFKRRPPAINYQVDRRADRLCGEDAAVQFLDGRASRDRL
jgi:hypothetical protein